MVIAKKKSDKYNNLKVRNEKILKLIFPAILYFEETAIFVKG